MPLSGGLDELAALSQMRSIAERSSEDINLVLQEAHTNARPYVSEGFGILRNAWFNPLVLEEGEQGALFSAESKHGLRANSLEEVVNSDQWSDVLDRPVPVRRVWGLNGLFWELLIQRLEARRPFSVCERCGRVIRGTRGKRFCEKEDDVTCFRERRASPDYARDLNSSEIWAQKKGRSPLI